MRRIDIKTGYLCNNNCLFCVQAHNKQLKNKPYESVIDDLRKGRETGCTGVVFTGGEFTVRPDCIKLVREAKKLGYEIIQIQSNGRMFSHMDFCRKIIVAGANEFSPALHGHIKELHDYLTSAESFEQTLQGIKNLKALGQYVIVNHVVVKPNYRHAPKFAQLMVDLGVDQFQYAFVHALGNAEKNFESMVPRISLAAPYIKEGIDIAVKGNVGVMVEAVPYCFMEGYEEFVAEQYMPETRIEEYDRSIDNYKTSRLDFMKLKGPK